MISMYNIQQSVEQSVPLCLEAHIGYEWMIAGYESEGDVAVVRSLSCVRIRHIL